MKTKVYTIAFALLLMACSPDSGGESGGGSSSDALINPSTGWNKVGTIAYTNSTLGLPGSQAMTPYDLTTVGNELALIYSEDFKFTGVQGNNAFKVKFSPNGGNITGSVPLQRGGYGFCYSTRFIPNSFTPVYVKITDENSPGMYVCFVGSDESGFIAGNNVGYSFPGSINWYPDGGLTMTVKGSAANGNISDALSYTFPNTGNFDVTEDQWSLDPTHWLQTAALRISGGEINQFILSYEGSKVYFSIIKNDPSYIPTTGVQHNFFMLARQEMPGLTAPNTTIIATHMVNNTYTILVGETGNGSGSLPVVKKVHCYQWQKGSGQFTKLYGDIVVPEDVGSNLLFTTTVGTRPILATGAPVKFTPDGTAYMLYNYTASGSGQTEQYTALATINAAGAKVRGKYALADYPQGHYDQVGLGVCEYFNGAYYAVAFQRHDQFYEFDDPKFRMEIVKLTP